MLKIPNSVMIHPTAEINVEDGEIGERTIIEAHASLEGKYIKIGAESWIGGYASIGGGSRFDDAAFLFAGDWLHLGPYAHINIARGVTIGDEVGIGWDSRIFTHGAYLSAMDGFPVQWEGVIIGNRVWMPNAWVNPGVHIWSDVVIAAKSLVNKDIPSGCLAGGIPAKILKENIYPSPPTPEGVEQLKQQLTAKLSEKIGLFTIFVDATHIALYSEGRLTVFNITSRVIEGTANKASELVKNQLRRNGIRFKYIEKDGEYVPW